MRSSISWRINHLISRLCLIRSFVRRLQSADGRARKLLAECLKKRGVELEVR